MKMRCQRAARGWLVWKRLWICWGVIRVVRGGRGSCWGLVVGGEVGGGMLMVRVLGGGEREQGRERGIGREGGEGM